MMRQVLALNPFQTEDIQESRMIWKQISEDLTDAKTTTEDRGCPSELNA